MPVSSPVIGSYQLQSMRIWFEILQYNWALSCSGVFEVDMPYELFHLLLFFFIVVDDVGWEISTTVVFCFTSEFALGRHWVKLKKNRLFADRLDDGVKNKNNLLLSSVSLRSLQIKFKIRSFASIQTASARKKPCRPHYSWFLNRAAGFPESLSVLDS